VYVLALSCVPSLAWADESIIEWVARRVTDEIVQPLAQREGSRFSRVIQPARERRVRTNQATFSVDKRGREFMPFAVDVKHGDGWKENDIVGCIYRDNDEVFVNRGGYRPAAFLLGKKVDPVPGACVGSVPVKRS
jgi:hypothetical protein